MQTLHAAGNPLFFPSQVRSSTICPACRYDPFRGFLRTIDTYVLGAFADEDHIKIILFSWVRSFSFPWNYHMLAVLSAGLLTMSSAWRLLRSGTIRRPCACHLDMLTFVWVCRCLALFCGDATQQRQAVLGRSIAGKQKIA